MIREWMGIDYHRVEKYYVLQRKIIFSSLCFLKKNSWKENYVEKWNDILVNVFINSNAAIVLFLFLFILFIYFLILFIILYK